METDTSSNTLLNEDLLNKIKGIQIRAKHIVNDAFAGEYVSAFKGRGMEFEEVREYVPGDDIRNIDWNVTARADKPFIKIFSDERELTVMFVVDVSASSKFGSGKKFKQEIAAEICALLAYLALKSKDKVGLIIFSDTVEHYIPPKKGRGHVWKLIRDILTFDSSSRKTDLNVPLEFLNRVIKKKAITFIISDFLGSDYQQQLRLTARRHDLVAIAIIDPREMELPRIGYIELEDAETGESILVNTGSKKFLQQFSKSSKKELKEKRLLFQKSGIDYLEVVTKDAYIDSIARFFREREKRKK